MVLENIEVEAETVASEDGHQFVTPTIKIDARALVGVFAQATAVAVAEDVGEKHLGIVACRFEKQHIGIGELVFIAIHADPHARMNDGAEGLREDNRQAAIVEILAFFCASVP